jgi:enoyl-CoA hydratase/carnithine racemase
MKLPLLPPLISDGQVLAETNGCLGLILLNRPQALNALSPAMVVDMTSLLQHWQRHPDIEAVVLMAAPDAAGATAFCAGADLGALLDASLASPAELAARLTDLQSLAQLIHGYSKPCIALLDGWVMSSAVGLSQGAKLRVLNEGSRLAMPDARQGSLPLAGSAHFLGLCPGAIGEWLLLTGCPIGAGDAIALGLADVFVPLSSWGGMLQALRTEPQPNAEHVVATLMERSELAPESQALQLRAAIDRSFSQPELAAVRAALQRDEKRDWANSVLERMAHHNDWAMALGLELVRRARAWTYADALRFEQGVAERHFDVATGVRLNAAARFANEAPAGMHWPVWQCEVPESDREARLAALFKDAEALTDPRGSVDAG